ncbi:MAG: hypothetical protein ABI353_09005 [Isosphaeraceae bacterium]
MSVASIRRVFNLRVIEMMTPGIYRLSRRSWIRRRNLFTIVFSVCGMLAAQTFAQTLLEKQAEPALAGQDRFKNEGPFKDVEAVNTVLHDPQRDKDLNVVVCFPKQPGGLYPVIVFSHGAGGSGRLVTALPKFWASHGYVVLCPTHADSISLSKERKEGEAGKPKGAGLRGLFGVPLNDPKTWTDRARDVSFLLDSLDDLGRKVPGLSGKMDPARIGVGGHSLGAYTAQLIGGATVNVPGEAKPRSLADDRPRAILLLSGQGTGQLGLTEHSWDHLARPLLSMTGTEDKGAKGQGHEWRGEPFQHAPPGDKYHIVIKGAHHGSFTGKFAGEGGAANGPGTGKRLTEAQKALLRKRFADRGPNQRADQKAIFGYVKTATLAFWDAYLKREPDAKAFLNSDALQLESHGAVTLSRK